MTRTICFATVLERIRPADQPDHGGGRDMPYESRGLHPVFQMNLPEGYVLEQLRHRLAKTTPFNPMLLMALTGSGSPVGRLRVDAPALDALLGRTAEPVGEKLVDLLAWDGASDLFTQLVGKYILRAGISGVQPKVIVPEQMAANPKAALLTSELIVKAGREASRGWLSMNSCALTRRGLQAFLSRSFTCRKRQLCVMRRFDRTPEQRPLGFEDMAVLTGLGTEEKYNSSYERIARAIRLFCAPHEVLPSLHQLFDMVALSCMVGNGEGHLKNFGLLYSDPDGSDARLAPAYDIVNTTAYLPDDSLALRLDGSKSLFSHGWGSWRLRSSVT